ncbi:Long-chain fatty acid transport protein 1, partial [Araneus ventricosus]
KLKYGSPTKTNNTIAKVEKISKFYTTSAREILNSIAPQDKVSFLQTATKLQPRAVLPPVEKRILQSRESDADAEMSSSSSLEEDTLDTLHVRGLRGLKCSFHSSTLC